MAYEDSLRVHVLVGVGALQVRELTVGVADRLLISVHGKAGPAAAKHAKTVLSGMMGLAVRQEAIAHNPLREVAPIAQAKEARALTLSEVRRLREGIRADKKAVERDLPDLVDFMLGTGLRIGETLAATWVSLDLAAEQVEVRGTVTRNKSGLLIQPRPRSRAGWRRLHLLDWLVVVLGTGSGWRPNGTSCSPPSSASSATVQHQRGPARRAQATRLRLGHQPHLPEDGGDAAR